jgi:hypothetical protein
VISLVIPQLDRGIDRGTILVAIKKQIGKKVGSKAIGIGSDADGERRRINWRPRPKVGPILDHLL